MTAPVPPDANDRRGIIQQAAERYLSDFDTVMNVRSEARDLAVAIDRALAASEAAPTAGEHYANCDGTDDCECAYTAWLESEPPLPPRLRPATPPADDASAS